MSLVSAADVAAAARTVLTAHLPGRLTKGLGGRRPLPAPTAYNQVPTQEAIRRVDRVALAVMVPGTVGPPTRFGDGSYDARWQLTVAVWHEQAADLPLLTAAADYAAAVRAVVLEHGSLGGLATQTAWDGDSVDLVGDGDSRRTLGLAVVDFTVHVPAVVDEDPLDDGTGPTVLETDVQVLPQPLP